MHCFPITSDQQSCFCRRKHIDLDLDCTSLCVQAPFIHENLVPDLCHVVCDSSNPEAQKHIAGTLRNLAVSQYVRVSIELYMIRSLDQVLYNGFKLFV